MKTVWQTCLAAVAGAFLAADASLAYQLLETPGALLSLDLYGRTDLVSFKNVVDLDSGNSDDTTTYLGIDYSIASRLEFKDNGPVWFVKLERNGVTDYDAPVFVHNTLMTSGGRVEAYRHDELLPQAEEFWLDTPLGGSTRFRAGLFSYEVGNGFALNGAYENYGCMLSFGREENRLRLHYVKPDVVNKNHLGPRIRQDEEQDVNYEPNAAHFFSADALFQKDKHRLQPYCGLLADYTAPEKRDNLFAASVRRDFLGTFGAAWGYEGEKLAFSLEAARNFGKAESDSADFRDIFHRGYFFYSGMSYALGRVTPSVRILVCSGNKSTLEMAATANPDGTLASSRNRAFSSFSPMNFNLDDSIGSCHCDTRPIVAMGTGYGLNNGVPRPGTFASSDFDNLIMPSAGLSLKLNDKLSGSIEGYYLRSFARPVGELDGEARYLAKELGYETDIFIDYQLNSHTIVSFLGGWFFPGQYYKERRDDTGGSALSPFVRGDGEADIAYQVEIAVEFTF